ncbi:MULTISPECIES: DUF333 domain-containing protein [Tatumella]|uniref:DUF333 domain-containing protein n=1 Tax=Tatumella punctata TaxID=399969 RepID=A0ABW1VJK1_9GAMM|nr:MULTISPECIES: DUF333 domain-containing protein [unclassified Tatumella]MBS0856490.1 DUF333 domain-containing protein [Tatumella sp. JGM16]MBS0876228.1 DUF333 domain-containing protein [Tatumella sp. JGM82]MBS0889277.1 DUF333 domain-containing protein [Tatumella sp. JGM94]MBS0893621.1 DUF333 domain-containing protein [Tatumella sp. JGM130]MBS0902309.1 DUF333 domain-containing protein [Tatumella sp. JGM100]
MKIAALLLASASLLLSACSSNNENDPPQQATAAHIQPVVMSSLAETNCADAGGRLAYSRQLDGSRIGMCQLANGKRCSENALIGGGCAL